MRAHSIELFGRGRTIVVTDLVRAYGRGAHERRDVGRHAALHQIVEVLAERRPRDVELDVALALLLVLLHLLAERPHRAFAEDGERDALADHALRSTVGNQRRLGVIQHVDETGRHREPRRVAFLPPLPSAEITARDDVIALHGDILDGAGRTGAVVDGSMPDDEVVIRLRRGGACADEERKKRGKQLSHAAKSNAIRQGRSSAVRATGRAGS